MSNLVEVDKNFKEEERERVAIVKKTFQNAVRANDQHVYFIKGSDLIVPNMMETATVDNAHPNDSGFVSMADALYKLLKNLIS